LYKGALYLSLPYPLSGFTKLFDVAADTFVHHHHHHHHHHRRRVPEGLGMFPVP
jgi:hypothetical protein